jgi:hypothetical protein
MNFKVAFWDSKSDVYMADVVLALMERLSKEKEF